jgi:oxygen-independent coproporphyrinogen-3 oxidase
MQEDRLLDLIMLQLRLSDGLDLQQLQRQFGARVCAALLPSIQQAMQHGTMALAAAGSVQGATLGAEEAALAQGAALQQQLDAGQPCRVRLTDPAGFLLSNDVISGLFAALDPSMLQEATGECV